MKTLNDYIAVYKKQLEKGDIQKAYTGLLKYLYSLKTHLSKQFEDRFSFGSAGQGYLDYTYFPFSDEFLKDNDLRFGIVLNHEKVQFELWLMGRNAKVQKEYWNILKTTEWNKDRKTMPKYSVLEVVLADNPDFDNPDSITNNIGKKLLPLTEEIICYLKNHQQK